MAENREVEQWLDEQNENKYLLDYLQKRKQQLGQPLKQTDIHDQWVLLLDRIFEQQNVAKPNRSSKNWFLGIAASLFLAASTWFYLAVVKEVPVQVITLNTPLNSRGHVKLPDGTEVYMAPNSKLTYTNKFDQDKRELNLTGEAFFDVKHKEHNAFIVHTADRVSVTVLGTSFNIYTRKNNGTEIKVATGLVGVIANNHTYFLKAGEQANYQTNKSMLVKAVDGKDAAALQNQTLYFKDDNATAIAQKLHRWYNLDFEVSAKADKHPHFSGEMKDTGVNNLLNALSYATGLKYKYTNNRTILFY